MRTPDELLQPQGVGKWGVVEQDLPAVSCTPDREHSDCMGTLVRGNQGAKEFKCLKTLIVRWGKG